ncbi:MAG: hypothetical protein BGP05_14095 [Rhizobiales bacterium 62-47]|mgnify:CR=1 FL=1|nr:hypothetical protein [Hyphomicrobiales bacterium]OJY11732.1 MAG: hypothetical protein BGP05_14095 [Rhizobiales bacterium 62-47]
MPQFDPDIVMTMRSALEQVMTLVPEQYATLGTKAYLAEAILKAAARGETCYEGFIAAGSCEIQSVIKLLFN